MSTPSIKNIDDIRSSTTRTRLIHFTTRQWEKAIKDLPVEEFDPARHGRLSGLVAWQDPDQVIVHPFCGGPGEICQLRQSFNSSTLSLKCFCRPDRSGRPGGGGGGSSQPFAMPECFWTIAKGKLTCSGKCSGTCRAVVIRQSFGKMINWLIVCRCVK